MLARRMKYPGTKGVIFRRVWDDLKVNHVDPFFLEHPELRKFYNVQDHEVLLPNGSMIKFMYAETRYDIDRKFMGPEFMDIFVDQAEQLTEEEMRIMNTSKRDKNMRPGMCKFVLFFNPGGPGTEFLRRIFFLRNNWKKHETPGDFAFIQAYGWDNYEWVRQSGLDIDVHQWYEDMDDTQRFHIFITETQYGRELNALPPSLRAGHLLGSFDSFVGQYYAGVWDESRHVLSIDETNELVEVWWNGWKAMDWGMAHNSAVLWAKTGRASVEKLRKIGVKSEKPLDIVVVHRELVVSEVDEIELAEMIAEMTPEDEIKYDRHFFLSPDAKSKRSSANTIKDQFSRIMRTHGLPRPEDADNERVAGWRLIYNMLKLSRDARFNDEPIEVQQEHPFPMLFVSAACTELIGGIPMLIRDKDDLEDVLKVDSVADDVCDGLRYLLKTYFQPRTKAPAKIRAMEVYNDERYTTQTSKAMALRIFAAKEKRKQNTRAHLLR